MASTSPLLALSTMGDDLGRVERTLRDAARADDAFLTEVASHLILAGGKRLRPALTIAASLAASAGGMAPSDDVIVGAVSCELVHLGSLYHDDVIDEAKTRRTVESVNARWGNLRAILAGDFLLARASELAASLGTEVAGLLAATISRLCEGEVRELQSAFDVARTEDAYYSSVEGKTASLFATSARIGAIVGGLDRPAIEALTVFGMRMGMAFQVVDDILDLVSTEAELGKPAGHDLFEGVYTLPVIHTLADGGAAAGELRDLLGHRIEGPELDKALALVRSNGGVGYAVDSARRFASEAADALAPLDDSVAVAALRAGAAHLVSTLP